MTQEEKIKKREEYNNFLHLVVKLHQLLYPELRYIQSLWALGIIDKENEIMDRFYEESYDTIIRILPTIQALLISADAMPKKSFHSKILITNITRYLQKLDLL